MGDLLNVKGRVDAQANPGLPGKSGNTFGFADTDDFI